MTKKFKDKDGKHIPYIEGKDFLGTARFSSVYTHLGIEQSRRDDLESIGYLLVYLYKGTLPWFDIEGTNKKYRYSKIMEAKRDLIYEDFCKEMPYELFDYFKYVRALQFDQTPDYDYLKSLIKSASNKANIKLDYEYDWEEKSKPRTAIEIISKTNINGKQVNDLINDKNIVDESNNINSKEKTQNENCDITPNLPEIDTCDTRTTTIKSDNVNVNTNKPIIVNKIIFGNNKFLVNK